MSRAERGEELDVDGHSLNKAQLQDELKGLVASWQPLLSMSTYASLLEASNVPAATRRKVERVRLSHQSVSLQFGLANCLKSPGHVVMDLPGMDRQRELFAQMPTEVKWPIYFVPTTTLPDLAPPGGSVIEMFHPVPAGMQLDDWDDEKKEALTRSAIAALRKRRQLDIAVTRLRTPRDLAQDLHLYRGALYGLSPIAESQEQFSYRTPMPGLFLAGGQSTWPGYGVPSSVMSGIFAAEAMIASPMTTAATRRSFLRGVSLSTA